MATTTNSLQSLNYHHNSTTHFRKQFITESPPSTISLLPKTNQKSIFFSSSTSTTTTTTFSLSSSSATTPSTSSQSTTSSSFDLLRDHLASQNLREADEETRRLLIVLAGEAAQKRGYVFFSEVKFIQEQDLREIDQLWKQHSNGRFGYSVQKKVWRKVNGDFTRFFIKVGWMKKLDTEVVQYNYRAFPDEFIWELESGDPPEGHLPLTNALRGAQLLNVILTHPAFEEESDGEISDDDGGGDQSSASNLKGTMGFSKALNRGASPSMLKPDYSF